MADVEESAMLNREEIHEGSSGEDVNSDFNSGKNDETAKTFKDLVGLPGKEEEETSF